MGFTLRALAYVFYLVRFSCRLQLVGFSLLVLTMGFGLLALACGQNTATFCGLSAGDPVPLTGRS